MPFLPEKILVPLLALMMVGDARAAPPTFTSRAHLRKAVEACLNIQSNGNCCAPENTINSQNIRAGYCVNDGNCIAGYTQLRYWDVSQVTSMNSSELCVFSIDLSPLPFVCCPLSFTARVISDSLSLLCVSSPYCTVFYNANAFNQPLHNWNVSSVTDMHASELCVISIDLSASPSLSCVVPSRSRCLLV